MVMPENQQNFIESSPSGGGDLSLTRDRLIVALLPHVMFDGWSAKALTAAAQEIGCDPLLAERLFPEGARDMVAHFVTLSDRLTLEDSKDLHLDGLGDKVRLLRVLDQRFARWAPYREAVKRALGVLALPNNLALAAKLSWGTVDAVWVAAGKSVHDFSWYTRRASLAAVYGATVLVWLNDPTPELSDTHTFLSHRLDDVGAVIKFRKRVGQAILPDRIRHRLFG